MDENERAPKSVMEAANRSPMRIQPPKPQDVLCGHRYFRIPFMRANANANTNDNGWNLNSDPSTLTFLLGSLLFLQFIDLIIHFLFVN